MSSASVSIQNERPTAWPKLALLTVIVGVLAGFGGMALGLLLRAVQHLAYGYGVHRLFAQESYLQGVSAAPPLRRFLALSICAVVAGLGWWALYRFGSRLVSIKSAVSENGPRMPFFSTFLHDLLQIVTVGLGSPLGREVAPRELGAAFATWLCRRAELTPSASRIMIACGAGAGLAAVYNVPLGGALFTLEVLLGTFSFPALIPAIATSVIATWVAWIGLGNEQQYVVPSLVISKSLVVWSILAGPIFGFAAHWFTRLTQAVRTQAPRNWHLVPWCLAVYPVIGLLAGQFPQLLGNGKGLTQVSLDSDLTIKASIVLLFLRLVVTTGALRAGAAGGLLTPGLTIGALFATFIGGLWNHVLPPVALGAFALVGAAAFLATSMKMPLTAIVLMFEFTRVGHDFLIPISFAVAGSVSVSYLYSLRSQAISVEKNTAASSQAASIPDDLRPIIELK